MTAPVNWRAIEEVLYVQEVVTHFIYKKGHYLLDRRLDCKLTIIKLIDL